MPTDSQAAVGLRSAAGSERARVQLALEARTRLAGTEVEALRGRLRRRGRAAHNRRLRRRRVSRRRRRHGRDRPAADGGSRIDVPRGIGRTDLEAVPTDSQAAVGLRSAAGSERARVQLALEARTRLAGTEVEALRGRLRRRGRAAHNRRLRRRRVSRRRRRRRRCGVRVVGCGRAIAGRDRRRARRW